MIYTELTKKAMRIAYYAHQHDVDDCGIPYIYHPIHLAEQMTIEDDIVVALLHDVVEDTVWTFDALINEGIPLRIIDTLRLLTRDSKTYFDYIGEIKQAGDTSAITVKLADLRHNSDLSRLDEIDERSIKRNEKYAAAIRILQSECN